MNDNRLNDVGAYGALIALLLGTIAVVGCFHVWIP
jgi:hypothetical protein